MSSVTVHLSDRARIDAERRAVESGFGSIEAYVASLVELDTADDVKVEALLLQRAAAADAGEMEPAHFEAIRAKVRSASSGRVR
jgi:hypothetical protein